MPSQDVYRQVGGAYNQQQAPPTLPPVRQRPRLKWVFTWDGRLARLLRITWNRGTPGDGVGYSCKLTLALRPSFYSWHREGDGWLLTIAGFRLHYRRSWGGRFDA